MFFILPLAMYLVVYIGAAVLPALFLMRYIYRKDTWEPEPTNLLVSLVVTGVVAALLSMVLESLVAPFVGGSILVQSTAQATILTAFLGVAVIEEGAKYYLLYRRTWNLRDFNYRFDAIVYAAFVSLGFAAFENILYVFRYGLSVALPRALLAIPGHLGFSVVFGYFYGRARLAANYGDKGRSTQSLITGYIAAVLLHGIYDSCALMGTSGSMLFFIVFVIVMYVFISRLIKFESQTDAPL